MASAVPATSARPTYRRPATFGLLSYVSTLLIVGVLGAIITLIWGHVRGYQFSPDNFQVRGFWYLRIPLVNLQIVSTSFDTATPLPAIVELNRQGYLPPPRNSLHWDTVEYTSQARATVGDAHYLRRYFDAAPASTAPFDWVNWSKKNPQFAALFWNAVVTMARDGLYLPASDLMEFAQDLPTAFDQAQVQQEFTERTLASYDEYARVWAEMGEAQRSQQCRSRIDEVRQRGWQRDVVPASSDESPSDDEPVQVDAL